MRDRLLASLFLFAAACFLSWLHQSPPSLGDDLNYWGLALGLHEGFPGAWSANSFHDLRWPVWGLCWLLQIPLGYGALSYYLQPMIYLGAGAVLVFHLSLAVGLNRNTSLCAGILFLFHPLLDSVIDRPMPDLSEGFWVALAFFCWLKLMESQKPATKIVLAALVGLAIAVGQANRITGVFSVPVLVAATLVFHRRQFHWLVLCGLFTAGFVAVEMAVYHQITGDWLHSLHANLGARGRKGTESIPLWELPFRFLPMLWRRHSDIIFNLLALGGFYLAFLRPPRGPKIIAAYAITYFLTYSCALQSIDPPRPLVRDGDRFLASLGYPLAILTAIGLVGLLQLVPARIRNRPALARLWSHPLAALAALALLCIAITSRPLRGSNYLDELAAQLDTAAPASRVLSHHAMREIAYLANPKAAASMDWIIRSDILRPSPETLAWAGRCQYVWFNRKWIWTSTRKKSESGSLDGIGAIGPYLRPPLDGWRIDRTVAKGDVPDFVFLSRRSPGEHISSTLADGSSIARKLFPNLHVPAQWTFTGDKTDAFELPAISIPPELRGRPILLALRYSSDETEPFRAGVRFLKGTDTLQFLTFKPYFFTESSEDFFIFEIPLDADTVEIRARVTSGTSRIELADFTLYVEPLPQ
jgi:hypothetical protein